MDKFKPVKNEKIVISIRIDSDVVKKVDKISNSIDISRNELITQCINYALENMQEIK